MDMSGTPTVAPWFTSLPLSDPRCNNDSCIAYYSAHNASQAEISWASQFLYGRYVVWIYVGFIGVFAMLYAVSVMVQLKPSLAKKDGSSVLQKTKASIRFLSYRRIPGVVGTYLALPSVGVIALIVVSVAATFIMAFVQHPYYRGSRGYGSPPLGVRAGLMAAAMIPLNVALAGKVNLVTMLTGIGHEKLNTIHRWSGWIMFIMASIHTVPFFLQEHREGILTSQFYKVGGYEFTGVPDYAFSFALVALSIPWIRRKAYEAFVWSHIIFAIVFLGLSFWHFGNELDSWDYLWATLAIWGFNLLGRIFWKTSAFSAREEWLRGYPALIRQCADDVLRVEVLVPDHWTWKPGHHVFLRFPRLNLFDNHPFTIASLPNSTLTEKGNRNAENVMVFLMRSYSGATGRLLSHSKPDSEVELSAVIDGPYGSRLPRYENCADQLLLVAGGAGITAVLPVFSYMSRVLSRSDEKCLTQSVHLVWMVRHASDLGWVTNELQTALSCTQPSGRLVLVDVYVTRESKNETLTNLANLKEETEIAESTADSGSELAIDGVTIHVSGRPNLAELIPGLVDTGRAAVLGCGPEGLKIDLSNTIARLQRRVFAGAASEISLQTESFDW